MKLTFAGHETRLTDADEERYRGELERVETLVADEPQANLHIVFARERNGDMRVSMSLDLPKRFLFASEADRSTDSALRRTCETLIRKVSRYRERLERGRASRSARKQPRSEETLIEAVVQGDFGAFTANIAEHIKRLRSVISWELHHDGRATKDVLRRISVDDLADEVLADVFSRYKEKPASLSSEQWMIRRALGLLDARVRETLREPREQQPDAEPDESKPPLREEYRDEYERLHDTFPDLYGHGEPTPMDRMTAGAGACPERVAENEELRREIYEALAGLPRDWRRTFSLHFLEGFNPGEVAELLKTSEDQVLQDIESSLAFMRAKLKSAGST